MKVPISWLREYVEIGEPIGVLARRLTMAGLEVEKVETIGEDWRGVSLAQVTDLQRHPRADSLYVARLDTADGAATAVTGAPNLYVGAVVPYVAPGGQLAAREIGRRTIQGVMSEGMLCSGDELGISRDSEGIYLMESGAPVGVALSDYLGETILDLYVTPNRPDCMSIFGVAREVHALLGGALRRIEAHPPAGAVAAVELVQVLVEDPIGCPRFTVAVVEGVSIMPSPAWLQRRLHFSGVRAISNVVDVTNYAMLETGQPLHAFDRDLLAGTTLVARRARPGESLMTLDRVERPLQPDMLVVADERRARSLAGIMGGEDSEISDRTVNVLVEGASWDRASIRLTAGAMNISSEAARRFGRGVDPELTAMAVSRAVQMVLELAGGRSADGLVDVYPEPQPPPTIVVRPGQVDALLGATYPRAQIVEILRSLEFEVLEQPSALEVTVPGHRRFDVASRADLAEEVARVAGYDSIPTTILAGAIPARRPDGDAGYAEELRARRLLAAAGLQEVITYSLLDPDRAAAFRWGPADTGEIVSIANPQSSERSVLRPSLIGSLLEAAGANMRHRKRVQLFELARTWLGPLDPLPTEERHVGLILLGPRDPQHWAVAEQPIGFFDAKGVVEHLCAGFNVDVQFVATSSPPAFMHPGRWASILAGGAPVGFVGELHPNAAAAAGMGAETVLVAEINFEALALDQSRVRAITAPSRYPSAQRDIAVVVDETLDQATVARAIADAAAPLLQELRLFDVYRGEPIPAGKKSLAFSLTYQSADRTLEDQEVSEAQARITGALREHLGGEIRGNDNAPA